jgi:penicillin-binding protein 1A
MAKKEAPKSLGKIKTLRQKILKWILILGVWGFIGLAGVIGWYAYDLPDIQNLDTKTRQSSMVFLTRDYHEIALQGDLYGETITVKDVPKALINALLATEDRTFFQHYGIDWKGLARAFVKNLVAGGYVQGGSTITQQLAKNLFLSPDRSISRKMREFLLALWLEHHFTKEQILNIYLNRVYLGNRTFGVDAAAQQYFGKLVSHLNTEECAVIVGLLKAPTRFGRNDDLLRDRAQIVLNNMLEEKYLTEEKHKRASETLKSMKFHKNPYGNNHRYFTDWISSEVEKLVDKRQDLIVVTTLDLPLQNTATQVLRARLAAIREDYHVGEGAFVAMGYDGAVRAMIGGHNYNSSQFNIAVQAKRQAGSVAKMMVFLAALELGYDMDMMISDKPYRNKSWTVKDYKWETKGEVSLRDALVYSVNTATVRLAQKVGVKKIIEVTERLGVADKPDANLTIALGTAESNLLELVKVMGVVANKGILVKPYGVLEIRTSSGKVLYKRNEEVTKEEEMREFDESVMDQMDNLLKLTVEVGRGKNAQIPDKNVRGKTGTSQNFRDAWFVGYTDDLVAGVWLGNPDDSPMNKVAGGNFPAKIWSEIIRTQKPQE